VELIFNRKLVPRRLIVRPASSVLAYETLPGQRSKLPIAAAEGRLGNIPDGELATNSAHRRLGTCRKGPRRSGSYAILGPTVTRISARYVAILWGLFDGDAVVRIRKAVADFHLTRRPALIGYDRSIVKIGRSCRSD